MKKLLLATALLAALVSNGSMADDTAWKCSKNICDGPAQGEILATVEQRYPDATDVWLIEERPKNGKSRYSVIFYTKDWHMECRLETERKPPLRNCHIIHA
jgi:hypothetical protein